MSSRISINFVLLGDPSIASALGKKGTSTDITIFDRKSDEAVLTWTVPTTFPDKIQSLVQSIGMGEFAILNVTRLDKYLGEQILVLDYAGVQDGFIMHSYEIDLERLKTLVKSTVLSKYKFVENVDELKQEIFKLKPKGAEGPTMIPVDHAFDVKGVGTVVLGVVKQGAVAVHDNLALMPSGKGVLVKSIQMHDDPVEQARSPSRVGLAIKGPNAEEISRGDIICTEGSVRAYSGLLSAKFVKSPFFKDELAENQTYMASIGLQVRTAKIHPRENEIGIYLEKPASYSLGQVCILLKPDSPSNRIVGKALLG